MATSGLTGLTPKQQSFVKDVVAGLSYSQSARRAGYSFPQVVGSEMMKNPAILEAIRAEQKKYADTAHITRKKVIDGLLEAIDSAKTMGDIPSVISAYRELSKLCGLYEPEKKQIDVSVSGAVHMNRIENLTTEELERIIQGEAVTVDDFNEDLIELPRLPQPEIPEDGDFVPADADSFK